MDLLQDRSEGHGSLFGSFAHGAPIWGDGEWIVLVTAPAVDSQFFDRRQAVVVGEFVTFEGQGCA